MEAQSERRRCAVSKVASDSGHWYDGKTGEPRYTVKGKNGKERPTRITDAQIGRAHV